MHALNVRDESAKGTEMRTYDAARRSGPGRRAAPSILIAHGESATGYGVAAAALREGCEVVAHLHDPQLLPCLKVAAEPAICVLGDREDCTPALMLAVRARFPSAALVLLDLDESATPPGFDAAIGPSALKDGLGRTLSSIALPARTSALAPGATPA